MTSLEICEGRGVDRVDHLPKKAWKLLGISAMEVVVDKCVPFLIWVHRNLWISVSGIYSCLVWRHSSEVVPTANCPSAKRHRPDIQAEFVQQWRLVMYAKVIFHILGLPLNVFHTKIQFQVIRFLENPTQCRYRQCYRPLWVMLLWVGRSYVFRKYKNNWMLFIINKVI